MNLHAIIDEIASQADDFLAGASNRDEARAGINELIAMDHASLPPTERQKVVAGVMAILEEEGFFEGGAGNSADEDEGDADGSED